MNRFSIAGLLAAGAMLFATLGCDTAVSEKEWNPEIPTTYAELDGTNSSDVTAVWDFSTLSTTSTGQWGSVISTSESTIKEGTEIKPSSGSKAALYAGTFKGKTNEKVLQSSKGTACLSSLGNAYSLVLNLEADSDVVIKAKGAGPQKPPALSQSMRLILTRTRRQQQQQEPLLSTKTTSLPQKMFCSSSRMHLPVRT